MSPRSSELPRLYPAPETTRKIEMHRRTLTVALMLLLMPLSLNAQGRKVEVSVDWSYVNASAQETDEGINVCVSLASMASIRKMPEAGKYDEFCLSNPEDAGIMLGVSVSPKSQCRYTAKGTAYVWLDNIDVLPEDEMYDERLQARLVSVEESSITEPVSMSCY
jgi:hypothetical protein